MRTVSYMFRYAMTVAYLESQTISYMIFFRGWVEIPTGSKFKPATCSERFLLTMADLVRI